LNSIYDQLEARLPKIHLTYALLLINVLVFVAMLLSGAGFWHSPNGVQLEWGANFGPATQDGEWWRLLSAMFLHFGVLHLALNGFALWDVGQLAERMFGRWRFIAIYLTSGIFGNVLSLVTQGNQAVSGGASGAIFGLYGAVLIFLWRERAYILPAEFKLLFGGGIAFAVLTIVMGQIVPGIDNAAHIGGFVAGLLAGIAFAQPINARAMPVRFSAGAYSLIVLASVVLLTHLPAPKYKWSDELLLRSVISDFTTENQAINRNWLTILHASKQGDQSFEELAANIDFSITKPYEQTFEKLSELPSDPALPSARQVENLKLYTESKKQQFEAIANSLRQQAEKTNSKKEAVKSSP
jgi:rhomboid protease GluP